VQQNDNAERLHNAPYHLHILSQINQYMTTTVIKLSTLIATVTVKCSHRSLQCCKRLATVTLD